MTKTKNANRTNNNIINQIINNNLDVDTLTKIAGCIDNLLQFAVESEEEEREQKQLQAYINNINDDVFNISILTNTDRRMPPYRVLINYRDMEAFFNYDGESEHIDLANLYEGTTTHGIRIYQTDRKHALNYCKDMRTCRRLHHTIISNDMYKFEEFIFKCAALVIDITNDNYSIKFNQVLQ